jgi:hypothetical protein
MQLHEIKDGYNYICTHVDDFCGMTKSLLHSYSSLAIGPLCYYLGNDAL